MGSPLDHIEAETNGEVLHLEIISTALNDFDLAHATANEIESTMSSSESGKTVLSLKNVDYITSVGLIVFARLIGYVKKTGARLVLCDAKEMVEEVLRISGVVTDDPDDISLPLAADGEAAVALLQ